MIQHLPDIGELPPDTLSMCVGLSVVIGILYCFLGYRLLKLVILLTGFMVGAAGGGLLCAWLSNNSLLIAAIGAGLAGLAGALSLRLLYKFGVFSLGGLGGIIVAGAFLEGSPDPWAPLAIVAAGLGGGLFALAMERFVMTLATAAIGAWIAVVGGTYFWFGKAFVEELGKPFEMGNRRFVIIAFWAALAIAGALVQYADRKHAAAPAKPA